ncbi:oxidoreductase [Candidatus Poribacteria bacterium]|nr:oxidoreductase [Candidatus Poribacteria bacterium]
MAADKKYRVVGTRPIRHDGVDKVTGAARFGADIHLPGMLHGAVLRSPHAHARVVSIDTSKAEAHPGVKATMTSRDLPRVADKLIEVGELTANLADESNRVLATGKVLYHGHPVAALAATDPHTALEALDLIDVEYDVLEPVMSAKEAMKDDAPLLHPNQKMQGIGEEDGKPSNVARHFRNERGDIEAGFAEADVIIEREYTTSTIHQGFIEPINATVSVEPDGRITIWTSTQGAFGVRGETAEICKIPVSKIRCIPMEIGGGFGGKTTVYLEPLALILSKKTGRPVKMTMSRAEVLQATGPTSGSHIYVKIGAKNDGSLTAIHTELAYEAGAFPGSPVGAAVGTMLAPYKLENVRIDAYDVVVNRPKSGAYRGPGATNAAFAAEAAMDELAEKLGIDPLELRVKTGVVDGDRRADGPVLGVIGHQETLRQLKDSDHWNTPLEQPSEGHVKRGRGLATGFWFNGGGPASAYVAAQADGTVNLVEGSTDIGGSRAACAMIVAEVLGLNAEDVNPQVADTDGIGYTSVTGGSSVIQKTGKASHEAATRVKEEVIRRAAKMWEVDADQVVYHTDGGTLTSEAKPDETLTFAEVARRANSTGGPIASESTTDGSGAGAAFATHLVDVEVDTETGKVDVIRFTAAQDVGTAIHPSYVEGQLEGGAVQGIGWALNEEYFYDDEGHLLNSSFLDYRMPTALDTPFIETIMVEVPNPNHPYGARGCGEACVVPPVGAIANAIYDAVGVRMYHAPMNPGHVLARMMEEG